MKVLSIDDRIVNIQLHGFSDASLRANRCCNYLIIEHKSGIAKSDLVLAKSRVSLIKTQSISTVGVISCKPLGKCICLCLWQFEKCI